MRTFVLLLITLVLTTDLFSQNNTPDLPAYYIKNKDTIGIIISIEQAQKIDNDLEILKLFRQSAVKADSLDRQYLMVIDKQQNKIGILELKTQKQDSMLQDQGAMVTQLNRIIGNYKSDLAKCDEQHALKDKIISNQEKDIMQLKLKKSFGYLLSAILGSLLLITLLK